MEKFLIVIFEQEPKVYLLDKKPEAQVEIDNETFNDAGFGNFVGFYDWLRNGSGHVIGVRLHPLAKGTTNFENHILKLNYVRASSETIGIDIFLSNEGTVSLPDSADQDYILCAFLVSPTRQAVAIGVRDIVYSTFSASIPINLR